MAGRISYSLYLTHWIVIVVCNLRIPSIAMYVQIPLCLAVAQLIWMTIERPSILLSRYVAKRLNAVQGSLELSLQRFFSSRRRVPT